MRGKGRVLRKQDGAANGQRGYERDLGHHGSGFLTEPPPPERVATVALEDQLGELVHELAQTARHGRIRHRAVAVGEVCGGVRID